MSRQTSLNFAPARKPLALVANTNGIKRARDEDKDEAS
jgi:hypothetical protein